MDGIFIQMSDPYVYYNMYSVKYVCDVCCFMSVKKKTLTVQTRDTADTPHTCVTSHDTPSLVYTQVQTTVDDTAR